MCAQAHFKKELALSISKMVPMTEPSMFENQQAAFNTKRVTITVFLFLGSFLKARLSSSPFQLSSDMPEAIFGIFLGPACCTCLLRSLFWVDVYPVYFTKAQNYRSSG